VIEEPRGGYSRQRDCSMKARFCLVGVIKVPEEGMVMNYPGASIPPEAMMHFPSVSDIPPVS